MASIAVGIDLGTSFLCVAVWDPAERRVCVLANDQAGCTRNCTSSPLTYCIRRAIDVLLASLP